MMDTVATVRPAPAPELLEGAVRYAEEGRVVFPVRNKRPLVRFGNLTPGPDHVREVEAWWKRWPNADIGFRTGDGIAVIDVDPRNGGGRKPTWPMTYTVLTRGGGYHYYFRTREDVRNSIGTVGPGIDVRGRNGFVIAPPSPGYVRYGSKFELAPFPASVLERVREGRAGVPAGWRPFEQRDHVPKGSQHAYLMSYGGWLWHSGAVDSEEELLEVMWLEASRCLAEPPDPQDWHEIRAMRNRVNWIVKQESESVR